MIHPLSVLLGGFGVKELHIHDGIGNSFDPAKTRYGAVFAGLSRIFHYEAGQICGNKMTVSALTAREVAPNSDRNFDVAIPQPVGRRIDESSMSISSEAGRWLIMDKANGETYPIPVSYSPAFARVA